MGITERCSNHQTYFNGYKASYQPYLNERMSQLESITQLQSVNWVSSSVLPVWRG